MALPNPSMTPNQQMQYMQYSTKEAVSTAFKASLLQMQSNLVTKSPLLRMIPGSQIIRDRAEVKKRELYEATGRDEQGRKLTKQEIEDREKRRKDLGALAEIKQIVQLWNDKGVPIVFAKDSDFGMIMERIDIYLKDIHQAMVGTIGTFATGNAAPDNLDALQQQEIAEEQEREDDQDQLESEQRQQSFFSKLFGGNKAAGEGGGKGLLGMLSSLLSPILGMFSGGLGSFVSKLIGPIGTALVSSLGAVTGVLGTILKAIVPFITTAFLPLLLAAGAGLIIKNAIEGKTEDMLKAGATRGKQSVKKKYEVSDGQGGTTLKTAEELGTTDFDIANAQDEAGISTLPGGERIRARGIDMVVDEAGNITNTLSSTNTKEQVEAYKAITGGGMQSMQAQDTRAFGADSLSKYPVVEESLDRLNFKMSQYQGLYDMNIKNINDPTTGQMLADGWNEIKDESMKFVKLLDEIEQDGPDGRRAADFGKRLLDIYSNQYNVFEDSLFDGNKFVEGYTKAQYLSGGAFMSAKLSLPSAKAGGLFGSGRVTQGAEDTTLMGTRTSDYDIEKAAKYPDLAPKPPSSSSLPGASSENGMLKSLPDMTQPIVAPSTSIQNNNNAVISTPPSARQQVGIDMSPRFQGARPALAF